MRWMLAFACLASLVGLYGCISDGTDTTSFAIENLTINQATATTSQTPDGGLITPPVFDISFNFANHSGDLETNGIVGVKIVAGAAEVDFGVDHVDSKVLGSCDFTNGLNPIWQVHPGMAKEVRIRVELPPSPNMSITTSCADVYNGPGFSDGISTQATWGQSGGFTFNYTGQMTLTIDGSTSEKGLRGNPFQATATATVEPPPED